MVHKTYRLHRAAPSEASPRGNRGDRLFHDCTRFWEKAGYPREPAQQLSTGNPRGSALFFWPGRGPSSFRQDEKKMGGAMRRERSANRQEKTDCHTSDIGHWFAMTYRGRLGGTRGKSYRRRHAGRRGRRPLQVEGRTGASGSSRTEQKNAQKNIETPPVRVHRRRSRLQLTCQGSI